MGCNKLTVGFSPHRTEALPFAAEVMRHHQAIILEEPEDPYFIKMLLKELSIDEYLLEVDFEFPVFARRSCELLRQLHAQGKKILQVEPFMERLQEIHDYFSQGGTPDGIDGESPHYPVYQAERRWTGALLHYYETSVGGGFDEVVSAVQAFAREDAARGNLRDALRSQGIAQAVESSGPAYLEAGELHIALLGHLRRRLPGSTSLRPVYLMGPAIREMTGKRHAMGPGDLLTLLYTFRPDYEGEKADLLAARNLIHVKIMAKEEILESGDRFPHTRDQIDSNRLVEGLSYPSCQRLFEEIRFRETDEARQVVREYRGRMNGG